MLEAEVGQDVCVGGQAAIGRGLQGGSGDHVTAGGTAGGGEPGGPGRTGTAGRRSLRSGLAPRVGTGARRRRRTGRVSQRGRLSARTGVLLRRRGRGSHDRGAGSGGRRSAGARERPHPPGSGNEGDHLWGADLGRRHAQWREGGPGRLRLGNRFGRLDARTIPARRGGRRARERGFSVGGARAGSRGRRLGGYGHRQLRGQPLGAQGPGIRRGLPGARGRRSAGAL